MERPQGVKIIAILAAIGGVLAILAGIGLMSVAGVVDSATETLRSVGVQTVSYPLFGASVWAIILIGLGVVYLVGAYGAWNLKKWAWPLLIGVMVFGIVQNLLFIGSTGAGAFVGIAINGAVLYYLFQVKESFSK